MAMYSSIAGAPPVGGVVLLDAGGEPVQVGLQVAQRQGLHDRPLVREELVYRADRHPGALGEQSGGESVVPDLVHQLGTCVEHPVHPGNAAPLHRHPAQRPGERLCSHVRSFPFAACS